MDIIEFKKLPFMGILRGIEEAHLEPLVASVISSGLKTIEVTMNTEGAANLIKKMVSLSKGKLAIGAGTVLNLSQMQEAIDAGASFIVSPVLVEDVTDHCAKNKIPVFPGAFTPQEVYNAWQAGATMVKVFPAKFFGPSYIKELKGPLNNIELLACGGVKPDNVAGFFNSGASAVAFGGSIFNHSLMKDGKFTKIEDNIKHLLDNYPACS